MRFVRKSKRNFQSQDADLTKKRDFHSHTMQNLGFDLIRKFSPNETESTSATSTTSDGFNRVSKRGYCKAENERGQPCNKRTNYTCCRCSNPLCKNCAVYTCKEYCLQDSDNETDNCRGLGFEEDSDDQFQSNSSGKINLSVEIERIN